MNFRFLVSIGMFACVFVGCSSDRPRVARYIDPSQQGRVGGTGIESQDLQAVTDKMVRSLLSSPKIAGAKRAPVIGLLPVENETRFPIDKDLFNKRMKAMLNTEAQGRMKFVARDRLPALQEEKRMRRSGEVTSPGKPEKFLGVDYFLTGELSGLSAAGSRGYSDYVLYTFRLIDADSSQEVWEDFDEIKKEGFEDVVYR